jgi:hypothetical protein
VAGCCVCGDEPSGSCATELVSYSCVPKSNVGLGMILIGLFPTVKVLYALCVNRCL